MGGHFPRFMNQGNVSTSQELIEQRRATKKRGLTLSEESRRALVAVLHPRALPLDEPLGDVQRLLGEALEGAGLGLNAVQRIACRLVSRRI